VPNTPSISAASAQRRPVGFRSRLKRTALKTIGQLRAWADPGALPFRGAFSSYKAALAAVRPGVLAGYDHDAVATMHEDKMQALLVWDYPVLYWLRRLAPDISCVLDAGGHTGVKYRAFARHLELDRIEWVVFDLPTVVKAARAKARPEERTLSFVERLEDAPAADVLLASGLMQYIDAQLQDLVPRMRTPPEFILLNKVATREGPMVVTLENSGVAETPYQIRNSEEIPRALSELGYEIVDEWTIPSLAHVIPTHPELGRSTSRGYAARLRR
jgi:putative methyltransferase (TIGR04325 family)